MNALDLPDIPFTSFQQMEHDYIGYQSLTDVPRALHYQQENRNYFQEFCHRSSAEIVEQVRSTESVYARCQLYGILLKREGPGYVVNEKRVDQQLQRLYHIAGGQRYWAAVRYASSLLNHTVDSISPFITAVLVHGKQLTVGCIGQKETVCDILNVTFKLFLQ